MSVKIYSHKEFPVVRAKEFFKFLGLEADYLLHLKRLPLEHVRRVEGATLVDGPLPPEGLDCKARKIQYLIPFSGIHWVLDCPELDLPQSIVDMARSGIIDSLRDWVHSKTSLPEIIQKDVPLPESSGV